MSFFTNAIMFLIFVLVTVVCMAASIQAMMIGDYTILCKLLLVIVCGIGCAVYSFLEMHQ